MTTTDQIKTLPAPKRCDHPWTPRRNRPTLYEIVITDGSRAFLLGYWGPGKSRRRVIEAFYRHAELLITLTGKEDAEIKGKWGKGTYRLVMGNWEVRYSGRTERDGRSNPYPFIREVDIGPQ